MAKVIEQGNFLVIQCTAREMYVACGSPGICDHCNEPSSKGYYVAVINCWLCPDCYEQWLSGAHWYPSDADVQRANFDYYAALLLGKC